MNRLNNRDKQLLIAALSQTTKRNGLIALTIILVLLVFGLSSPDRSDDQAFSQERTGPYEVVRVIDGDTIVISKQGSHESVRLIGVDTPEVDGPYTQAECFGDEASEFTRSMLENELVWLEADESQDERDRYDRLLRYVYLGNTHFNKLLIDEGYAYEYTFRTAYRYQNVFNTAQSAARENSTGLWSEATCAGSTAIEAIDFKHTGTEPTVTDDECLHFSAAPDNIGSDTCVTGTVDHVFISSTDTTFINFCEDYRTCPFTSVIFTNDRAAFDNLSQLDGEAVRIDGRIDTYQGRPQIILREPDQLTLQ
jgi:endonuclease YncB( thermonuclease family)